MSELRVWAPRAAQLDVEVAGARRAMQRVDGGWWVVDEDRLVHGADYWLVLDDVRLPDPRSRWQPTGIDGPSRRCDPARFAWQDDAWRGFDLDTSVLYELHVGTFTPEGTYDAVTTRLDHLVELGIDAIQLMPANAYSGRHGWGYDGVLWYAVHEPYGGPPGLARFVDACHQRGLGVLLDVVYNHLGPAGNHLDRFGPYFTDRYRTLWGPAVNYDDAGSAEVRAYAIDNALAWLRDYHLDGLRLDAVHAIFDQSAVHVLEELSIAVTQLADELGRPLWLVAESDLNDPRVVSPRDLGGLGMDAQWSDDFHHALHAALTGERSGYYADFGPLADVATALRQAYVYDGRYSAYRDRRHGRPALGLEGQRFLGYLQTHDQVGNRAQGERTSQLLSPGLLRVGAALVLTSPFVPMLFMGEEWGATTPFQYFTDHTDPELAEAVRSGRRAEFAAFGWDPADVPDPQDAATFARSRLDWSEPQRKPHADLLDWHRRLISLRRTTPELREGSLARVHVQYDEDGRWLAVRRGDVAVLANLAAEPRTLPISSRDVLLASDDVECAPGWTRLAAESAAVVRA